MASHSTDSHEFVKQILLEWFDPEVILHQEVDNVMSQVQSVLVSDSRNLYDALAQIESSGLHLEEKRTAIEVLSIRERTKAAGIGLRWMDGDQQLADGLSKNNEYDQLIEIFRNGKFRLVFDPTFMSAKNKKKRQVVSKNRKMSQDGDSHAWHCKRKFWIGVKSPARIAVSTAVRAQRAPGTTVHCRMEKPASARRLCF